MLGGDADQRPRHERCPDGNEAEQAADDDPLRTARALEDPEPSGEGGGAHHGSDHRDAAGERGESAQCLLEAIADASGDDIGFHDVQCVTQTRRCDTGRMFWSEYPRDVVQVAGADAFTYLQSQLSQELRPLQVGGSVWSFVLQPTGKVDVLLRVWRTADDTFVLDTDAGFGEALVARLNRFKIRVKAEISTLDWRCVAVRGEGAGEIDGLAAWGAGVDLLGPDPQPPADAQPGSPEQLLAARIAAVWPQMGAEIEPGETIPAETGILAVAVSFTKGCYPGQELVERMDSRAAAAPRLLQLVEVPVGTSPGAGYVLDGAVVGTITSVNDGKALAFVKRSALLH